MSGVRTTERATTAAVEKLWLEYKRTGDVQLRNRLVLTLAPMVKYIVYKKMREIPSRCEVEDFVSCGLEALMRSIDRYDPARGATLEQFAWTRIHGSVLDELRKNDWAPRSLRHWEREIARARERFLALYGRAPSRAELSDAVGITTTELERHLRDIQRSDVGSLNVLVASDEDTTIDTLTSDDVGVDPERSAMCAGAKEQFRVAFARLPERERQVAVLLYVHNLTLREIGDALNVSESRVCQLHSQLRKRLREQLAAHELLLSEVA